MVHGLGFGMEYEVGADGFAERDVQRLFVADGQPILGDCKGLRATVRRGRGDLILRDHSSKSYRHTTPMPRITTTKTYAYRLIR